MLKLFSITLFICSLTISAYATDFIFMGTGGITGKYYISGGAMCYLINKEKRQNSLRCSVESTAGSVYNIDTLRDNELTIAIAQSDVHYAAYKAEGLFKDNPPFKELRSLFSLYGEPFTVIARADSGIKSFDDLKGKRVNIGNEGSGHRSTMEVLMQAKGWSKKTFSKVLELPPSRQRDALCGNEVDAIVYAVGHPSLAVQSIFDNCNVRIIDVKGDAVDTLVGKHSFYAKTIIPSGTYSAQKNDVQTFGVSATVVTRKNVPNNVIYKFVKTIFSGFNEFVTLDPVFANLNKTSMISDSLTAPLHEGAIEYYKEAGLVQK